MIQELILGGVTIPLLLALFAVNRAEVKGIKQDLRKALYDDTGSTIYIPRKEFKAVQQGCQNAICNKIEELKAVVLEVETKREDDSKDLHQLMGRVEQYLEDTKN